MDQKIVDYLGQHNIVYKLYEHPAVFTCEEAAVHCKHVPGMPVKNLFLRDKDSEQYFLVVLPDHKRLQVRALGKEVG
jgi:Ala-tRNA(Pro) deacylase